MQKSIADSKSSLPVVTLRTFSKAPSVETSGVENTGNADLARYERVISAVAEETSKCGADIFISVQDGDASRIQSAIAEGGNLGSPLQSGGLEAQFGEGLTGGDLIGWALSIMDHIGAKNWRPIIRPPDTTADALPNSGRMAILSDWGTGLYGAPASAASIERTGGYEIVWHLGDVYYSGTQREIRSRFLDLWPTGAGKISRALNGNHEMYSGGYAYFDTLLPEFCQPSSYFAFQNDHWIFVGLDTAHTEHDLDNEQVSWLMAVLRKAGSRKIVLFSHHQPYSRLDKQGPKLQEALKDLLQMRAITAWYWGHEHNCVVYDRHPTFGLLGRCIGNGGVPSPRYSEVRNALQYLESAGVRWMRIEPNDNAPGCLVLDGPNPYVVGEEERFGPHGYLTLEFDGERLTECIHLPDGIEIFKMDIA